MCGNGYPKHVYGRTAVQTRGIKLNIPSTSGGGRIFFKVNDDFWKNIHFLGKLLNKKRGEIQNCGGKKFKHH